MPTIDPIETTIDKEVIDGLVKDQIPSNVDSARSPDGFNVSDPKQPLEGFQILQPASGHEPTSPKPEPVSESETEPDRNSINPTWVEDENDHWNPANLSKEKENITRVDLENPRDEEDPSNELAYDPDVSWEELKERYDALGLPKEDFPDDVIGTPEESIIRELLQTEIVNAEFGKFEMSVVKPDVDGKQYEVKFMVDRIENPALRTKLNSLIERHGEDYLPIIWEKATEVDVYNNRDGVGMIMVKGGKDEDGYQPFLVMSTTDLSRMLSVPSVKEGNSRIDFPSIDPNLSKDRYRIISILTKIRHDGKPIGGKDFKNYIFR